ncbi:hypothetical protein Aduo_018158 [Ancylostoma duodenale]
MWIILVVLALAAVEAGRYGAPQMEPSYRPSYSPQYAPSYQPYPYYMPWWIYGHHRHWWSDSESSEHHRHRHHDSHRHHHHRYPAKPACSRCPMLGRAFAKNSTTMASIQYVEQSNGCMQVILGCPVSNGSFLLVREKGSAEVKPVAAGVGIKVLLECTRERKWTPYTINGMNIEAVGCSEMTDEQTDDILNLNFTQPVPMKQKRHTTDHEADYRTPPPDMEQYSDYEKEPLEEDAEDNLKAVHPEKQHI